MFQSSIMKLDVKIIARLFDKKYFPVCEKENSVNIMKIVVKLCGAFSEKIDFLKLMMILKYRKLIDTPKKKERMGGISFFIQFISLSAGCFCVHQNLVIICEL